MKEKIIMTKDMENICPHEEPTLLPGIVQYWTFRMRYSAMAQQRIDSVKSVIMMYSLTATHTKAPSKKAEAAPRPCSMRKLANAVSWSSGQLMLTKTENEIMF